MQQLSDGRIVFSASDLTSAAECEWGLARKLDKLVGHDIDVPKSDDAMMARAGKLGDIHEQNMLDSLNLKFPGQVASFERPDYDDPETPWLKQMTAVSEATLVALQAHTPVVFQGAFFDGEFQGFADFLILNEEGEYEVNDTKLARKAKITALIQLAAYADQLRKNGIPTSNNVHLLLGNGKTSTHDLRDILPVYLKRRQQMLELISARKKNFEQGGQPSPWNDPHYRACGTCAVCEPHIEENDDILKVAGLSLSQRARFRAAGIETLEQLATTTHVAIPGISDRTFAQLKAQAEVQLETRNSATPDVPAYRIHNPRALAVIPPASPGDIFFDFEGDPLYQEGDIWNLDYLFGYVNDKREFTPIWAHNFAEEKQALLRFIDKVKALRNAYPDMHIYHYASYERTHLLSLAARYGVGEMFIDDLLRNNVLVDLYPVVKNAMRVGSYSYSIKKLEPLYMQDEDERDELATAADSVIEYAKYCALIASGEHEEAQQKLQEIADYNEYDCVSTLVLRDWLRARADELGIDPLPASERVVKEITEDTAPLFDELMALINEVPLEERTADHTAVALTAAAIDFHRREDKSFWWEHYNRLITPIEDWEDTRDVYVIDEVEIVEEWHKPTPRHNLRRVYRVCTTPAPGSKMRDGAKLFMAFPADSVDIPETGDPGSLRIRKVELLEIHDETTFTVAEVLPKTGIPHSYLPIAITPGTPPDTKGLAAAIAEWGQELLAHYPTMPENASMDILRRIDPRGPGIVPHGKGETYEAIRDSLLAMNNSYVAVQGPPGAGKSHNGGRVIADLVLKQGWKVGVVGQSHATVENLLGGVAKAGVPLELIGKAIRDEDDPQEISSRESTKWTPLKRKTVADFLDEREGAVIGGTVWDFVNTDRVARGQLDLLVIDEAGQYSLANTIAASVSAKRLLLLGDPQQLPQVTQGTHPEPIDGSALGWLINQEEVLPSHLGYFLDTSWRMNESVCSIISELSYDGKLTAKPNDRHLEDVEPGFFPIAVPHLNNSTESVEEADEVVKLVNELIEKNWHDKNESTPLRDVTENIIVVAPYNAQVNLIRSKLDAAGHHQIRVGTVDKFQGQEAAVAIVSLAASSAAEVPRGIEFLLMTNRLNVAISRAKWAAYMFYSPELTEFLPTNIKDLRLLSRFITLVDK